MDVDIFPFLIVFLSPAIGSFIGVLADRLARGEDVVSAPSRCRACGTRLGVSDLVPLASYLLLRGRCRHCRAPVPLVLFLTELLALGAAVLVVIAGGDQVQMGLAALWLWLLLALAVSDLMWMRLPDPLTAAAVVLALGLSVSPGGVGLGAALVGGVLGAGSFWLLRAGYQAIRGRAGLGLGDVKLMAGLGAFAGPYDLPYLVLIGALTALMAALLTARGSGEGLAATRALPFGAALSFAAAVLWLLRNTA